MDERHTGRMVDDGVAERDRPSVDVDGRELEAAMQGVVLKRLAPLVDHRGSLVQLLDARESFWSEPVVFAYDGARAWVTTASRGV